MNKEYRREHRKKQFGYRKERETAEVIGQMEMYRGRDRKVQHVL